MREREHPYRKNCCTWHPGEGLRREEGCWQNCEAHQETREVVAAGRPTLKASSHAATEAALYASEITNLGDLLCLDAARVRRFYAALATYDLL